MRQKFVKAIRVLMIIFAVAVSFPQNQAATKVQAASIKISAKKLSLTVGQSKKLKIKGTKKKVKWSSSNKKIATVTSKGKVTAKKKGKAKITAKVRKKKYICKVTVKKKDSTSASTPTPPSASNPVLEPTETPTVQPTENKFSMLKDYILTYGKENSNGDKFITSDYDSEGDTTGIVYNSSSNLFEFLLVSSDDAGAANMSLSLTISETDIKNGDFKFIITYNSELYGTCNACETLSTLREDSILNWTVENGNIPEETLIDIANSGYEAAYYCWKLLLLSKVDLSMSDIGFME